MVPLPTNSQSEVSLQLTAVSGTLAAAGWGSAVQVTCAGPPAYWLTPRPETAVQLTDELQETPRRPTEEVAGISPGAQLAPPSRVLITPPGSRFWSKFRAVPTAVHAEALAHETPVRGLIPPGDVAWFQVAPESVVESASIAPLS